MRKERMNQSIKENKMKANQFKTIQTCRLLSVLLACMLWPANELCSQVVYNAGVDMTKLSAPGHYIYFGTYDHAKMEMKEVSLESNEKRIDFKGREGKARPILWRVMGKEPNNGANDGAITLMSEYVLDTAIFTTTGVTWLNSTFINNFTSKEQLLIKENTVYTPIYATSSLDDLTKVPGIINPTSPSISKFYLPWGTPYRESAVAKGNKMLWTLDTTFVAANILAPKSAGPKGEKFEDTEFETDADPIPTNIYYWLRSLTNAGQALIVQASGKINVANIGEVSGVRPMFRLDTTKILFASELKLANENIRLDQMYSNDDYRDDEGIANGKSGKGYAYKLTVVNTDITVDMASPTLDMDETITSGSRVLVRPGDMVPCAVTNVVNATKLAYKIVDGNSKLMRYDVAPITQGDTCVYLVAKNLNREGAGVLNDGEYTAYIWAQKNNETQSDEGSEPKQFTLKVYDDDMAPKISQTENVYRSYAEGYWGDTAIVKFHMNESLGGKYYYYVTNAPLSPEPSAEKLIKLALTSDGPSVPSGTGITVPFRSGKQAFSGSGNHSITLFFKDNLPHDLYLVAKDSVRNTSEVLHIPILPYVPNHKPVGKDQTVYLEEGIPKTLTVADIASDEDLDRGDRLTLNSVLTYPDNKVATVTYTNDQLTINPVAPGAASMTVEVYDNTKIPPGPTGKDTVTIEIAVRERTPEAEIDYVTEELTNLRQGYYLISGDTVAIPADTTTYPIADKWFGATLSIVRIQLGKPTVNSTAQELLVPSRPAAPELTVTGESFNGYKDGQIYGVSPAMEYKLDTMNWIPIQDRRTLEGLAPGVYQVRMRVVPEHSFVGVAATVTVRPGVSWTPIMRIVFMPEVTGITTFPTAGRHIISSMSDFTFTVKFSHSVTPVRTSRFFNGVQEELKGVFDPEDGSYTYTIRNVQEPVAIYLDPNVGLTEVDNDEPSAVWSAPGQVYVKTDWDDTVVIYGLSGVIVKRTELTEGVTAIPLSAGLYIVTLEKSGIKRKIRIQ
jgi:hypothetical protein